MPLTMLSSIESDPTDFDVLSIAEDWLSANAPLDSEFYVLCLADDWHSAQTQLDSEFHILPSVGVQLSLYNSVHPEYKQLPQWVHSQCNLTDIAGA